MASALAIPSSAFKHRLKPPSIAAPMGWSAAKRFRPEATPASRLPRGQAGVSRDFVTDLPAPPHLSGMRPRPLNSPGSPSRYSQRWRSPPAKAAVGLRKRLPPAVQRTSPRRAESRPRVVAPAAVEHSAPAQGRAQAPARSPPAGAEPRPEVIRARPEAERARAIPAAKPALDPAARASRDHRRNIRWHDRRRRRLQSCLRGRPELRERELRLYGCHGEQLRRVVRRSE